MKNKLVVTLTTVHGSRQFSLNQLARYLLVIFLFLGALSFFISNPLLLLTSEDLEALEGDHEQLSQDYELILGSQQLHKSEMDELAAALDALMGEKTLLEEENLRIGELNASLDQSLVGLETLLGLPVSEQMTGERAEKLKVMANKRLYFLHMIPNGVPIQSPRITARFGPRLHPVLKKRHVHHGIDFKANIGTPVYATADAIVEFAGFHKQSGFGNLIILQHSFGFRTYYAHLKKVKVSTRGFVRKGQLIGYSGNTGLSSGPHLHYEVRHLFSPLDPAPFLAWNMSNFDSLFSKVKDVKWASLQEMYPLNQSRVAQLEPPSSPKETRSAER